MKKFSLVLILAVIAVTAIAFTSSSVAKSSNECASCHLSKYYQYLDILEGNSGNSIPSSLSVGESKMVTVVLQNLNNAAMYNYLRDLRITLKSKNGSFNVNQAVVTASDLPPGTMTATWHITGIKAGQDSLVITASATNRHKSPQFTDVYSPEPTINVTPPPPTTYQLTIQSPEGSGSTSPDTGSYNKTANSMINIDATPSTGWTFDHWTLDGARSGNSPTISVTMEGNHSLRATFNQTIKPEPPPVNPPSTPPPEPPPVTPPPVVPPPPPTPPKFNVTIWVYEPLQSTPIANATATLGGVTKSSDESGSCYFTVEASTCTLIIAKPGYSQINENITVESALTLERMLIQNAPPPASEAPIAATDSAGGILVSSLSLGAYLTMFAFTLVTSLRKDGRGILIGMILFSLTLTSAILVTRVASWPNVGESSWRWDPVSTTTVAAFSLVVVTLLSFLRNHTGLSKASALISSVVLIYIMSNSPQITAMYSVLSIPILWNDYSEFKGKAIANRGRLRYVKANRAISWVFAAVTVVTIATGYALTRFHVDPVLMMQIHTGLGYTFGAILLVHIYLSVISKYPWLAIIRGFFSGKHNSWSLARLLQVVTAVGLILYGVLQTLSGLGFINSTAANLIPIGLHLDLDGLLVALFILHAAIGVKAVAMRNRITTPVMSKLITGLTATLVLSALLIALVV